MLYGDNSVKAFEGEITLLNAHDPTEELPVDLVVYRVSCADSNRSVVFLEFAIPARLDPANTYYQILTVRAGYDAPLFPTGNLIRLSEEPNNWGGTDPDGSNVVFGGNTTGTTDGHDRRWVFVFDNPSPWASEFVTYPDD